MARPTISVIIPAYNVAPYIQEALRSLADQDELPDEVIIIDDGSLDHTLEVITQFPHPYPVTIISTSNQGQGCARNLGLSTSGGDYVYFFDADDILASCFISAMKSVLEGNALPDIVFFSGKSFHEVGAEHLFKMDYRRGFNGNYHSPLDILRGLDSESKVSCSPCLYISKRSLWFDASLSFIEHYHEDEHILYPLILAARRYHVTDECYFFRRVRHGSTVTQEKNVRHLLGYRDTVLSLLKLESSMQDTVIRGFVRARAIRFMKKYIYLATRNGIGMELGFLKSTILGLRSAELFAYLIYRGCGAMPRTLARRIRGHRTTIEVSG